MPQTCTGEREMDFARPTSYATAIAFLGISLITAVLSVLSTTPSVWGRSGGLLLALLSLVFARFFFADAERDRLALYPPKGP